MKLSRHFLGGETLPLVVSPCKPPKSKVLLMTGILAGGISAAAGPIGTGGQVAASLANPAPMFSYSRSKGKILRHIAANNRN